MSNNIEHTMQFDLSKNKEALTKTILTEVYNSLQQKGYNIARRTVAKYREQLDIPVARLRKEM